MIRAGATLAWQALRGMVAWLCLLPFRALVRRDPRMIAVLGRADGHFADNCKYFYIDSQAATSWRVIYVTRHETVERALSAAGTPVVRYPSWKGIWCLLRSGAAVVDTTEWSQRGRREWLAGSRIVQLWHGVGFKRIELDRWWHERTSVRSFRCRTFFYRLSGRLVRYEAVLATSRFYASELFSHAFLHRHILLANYPRNTFGLSSGPAAELALFGVDTAALECIRSWKEDTQRVVIVTPTFRDDGRHCLPITDAERRLIEDFCRTHRIRLAFKMHPSDPSTIELSPDIACVCAPRSDIYPLLHYADAMVTDYSSIYMDYLVLDRPVLFYVPDLAAYMARRELQFDFDAMTPGARATTWPGLLDALVEQLATDTHVVERTTLRKKAFDDHDPATSTRQVLELLGREHPG